MNKKFYVMFILEKGVYKKEVVVARNKRVIKKSAKGKYKILYVKEVKE